MNACHRPSALVTSSQVAGRAHAAVALLAAAALLVLPAARANPLNPLDFPSLGAVTLVVGAYAIDTGATPPTITGPINLVGTVHGNGASGIAVFSFDALTIPAAVNITVTGNRPLALLSAGDMNIACAFSVNGGGGGNYGGPGGAGVAGGGAGGVAGAGTTSGVSRGGAGGGPGGGGGGLYPGGLGTNGAAGVLYGQLPLRLEAGSGGGGGAGVSSSHGGGAGAGGGALEFGALGSLTIAAPLAANGGAGGTGGGQAGGGGGGSGGGILLHAFTLTLPSSPSSVTANGGAAGIGNGTFRGGGAGGGYGGNGGSAGSSLFARGGGGGGGRVAIQSVNVPDTSGVSVSADSSSSFPGAPGVITSARVALTPTNLDFGSVPVGTSKTLGMLIQNTGDPDTSANGRFPDAGAPFTRVGAGVFSSLKPGRIHAVKYTFTPATSGFFSEQLTFLSNAGPVTVTISGTGVSDCPSDINGDGEIDLADFAELQIDWGTTCP